MRAPSSSAAASSAARPPITWPSWAGRTRSSSSGTSSRPARRTTRPGSSGSCAPAPTSRSCSASRSRSTTRSRRRPGLASGWKMNGGLRLACNQARWIELKRQATTRAVLWPGDAAAHAARGARAVAADGHRRPGRRGLPADRRPGESLRHHPVAGQGRAPARRAHLSRTPRCSASSSSAAACGGAHHTRARELRSGGELRRPMGAAGRRCWRASTCRWSRCSTST